MEARESDMLNFISNTTGRMRLSIQDLSIALDLLSDRLDLFDRDTANCMASALRSIYQLQRMSTYLDLYRQLSCQQYPLDRREGRLRSFFGDLAESVESLFQTIGTVLRADLPASLPMAFLDPDLVGMMTLELLSNAAAHASDKIVRLSVRLAQPDLLVVRVSNRSETPFPEQLFERYLAEPEEFTGTVGLGLQIVSRGARCHGGSLVLSNGPEQTVEAVMSIRLAEQPSPDCLRMVPALLADISLPHMTLSTILPASAYDPRDLQ